VVGGVRTGGPPLWRGPPRRRRGRGPAGREGSTPRPASQATAESASPRGGGARDRGQLWTARRRRRRSRRSPGTGGRRWRRTGWLTDGAGPGRTPPGVAVPLNEERPRVRQGRAPDPGAGGAEPAQGDGEAGDVADDRHGLAGVGAGDLPEGRRHAGDDLLPRLAIGRAAAEVLPDDPGAELGGGAGHLDQLRQGRDREPRGGREEGRGLPGSPGGAGVDPGDRLGGELPGGDDGLAAPQLGQTAVSSRPPQHGIRLGLGVAQTPHPHPHAVAHAAGSPRSRCSGCTFPAGPSRRGAGGRLKTALTAPRDPGRYTPSRRFTGLEHCSRLAHSCNPSACRSVTRGGSWPRALPTRRR
jgi:hypothetical protein